MALQRFDRIAETTTTTGTGTYDLAGAKVGFEAFVTRVTSGNTVEYCCTDNTDWEIGIGTFTDASPDTMARTTVLASSNSDAAVNWAAGTRDIFLTLPASRLVPAAANEVAYHSSASVLAGDPDFTFDGTDLIARGKMDIGAPGAGTGLDIGEGGSYSADKGGTTIVQAFKYDASASSGARFTELTIDANNTLLGDAGDRFYVGSTSKFWAMRCTIGVLKTSETLLGFYYNGSALVAATIMGTLKTSVTTLGTAIFEQTSEQEYVTFDKAIDTDWAAADNVLDVIPDTASALFWFVLQVPVGDLTTPPRIDDIKVRGTDVDFATGSSQIIHWGKARVAVPFSIGGFADRSAAQPVISDESFSAGTLVPAFKLRNNQSDGVDFIWKLPQGIDTSSKVKVTLDWFASATGGVEFDLIYKIAKQATVVGVGESDPATVTTTITPSAAAALQTDDDLTPSALIDISSLSVGDLIIFTLLRDGTADANAGSVFPLEVSISHVLWTAGEHV